MVAWGATPSRYGQPQACCQWGTNGAAAECGCEGVNERAWASELRSRLRSTSLKRSLLPGTLLREHVHGGHDSRCIARRLLHGTARVCGRPPASPVLSCLLHLQHLCTSGQLRSNAVCGPPAYASWACGGCRRVHRQRGRPSLRAAAPLQPPLCDQPPMSHLNTHPAIAPHTQALDHLHPELADDVRCVMGCATHAARCKPCVETLDLMCPARSNLKEQDRSCHAQSVETLCLVCGLTLVSSAQQQNHIGSRSWLISERSKQPLIGAIHTPVRSHTAWARAEQEVPVRLPAPHGSGAACFPALCTVQPMHTGIYAQVARTARAGHQRPEPCAREGAGGKELAQHYGPARDSVVRGG